MTKYKVVSNRGFVVDESSDFKVAEIVRDIVNSFWGYERLHIEQVEEQRND